MQALHILLLDGFDWYKAHGGPLQRLEDRFGFVAVSLVSLHERLYELRADEFYYVTLLLKLPRPMMGA